MSLTPEQIAEIAQQAAVAAVMAALGGAQAPSTPAVVAAPEVVDADAEEIRRSTEEQRQRAARIEVLVKELVPLIMQPRHLEVFIWWAGDDWSKAVQQTLRAAVQKLQPDYREALGGGGNSSRNLEGLSERLPVRK